LRKNGLALAMTGTALGFLAGCNVITEEAPTDPTPVTTTTLASNPIAVPVIQAPILVPNPPPLGSPPSAGPNPRPNPSPNPAPTSPPPKPPDPEPEPGPAPPARGGGCGLPPQRGDVKCSHTGAAFGDDVEAAIDRVIAEHPEYFNLGDNKGYNTPRILNYRGYENGVVNALSRQGYCVFFDGEELAVAADGAFSEHYDISSATGYVRRGPLTYISTCRPGWF
jgi:hypothetical protein